MFNLILYNKVVVICKNPVALVKTNYQNLSVPQSSLNPEVQSVVKVDHSLGRKTKVEMSSLIA